MGLIILKLAPTARMESVRILMQLVVNFDLLLRQVDVNSIYLHAQLKCDVYVSQTPGFEQLDKNGNDWKLNNSPHGLKQSVIIGIIGIIYCTIF